MRYLMASGLFRHQPQRSNSPYVEDDDCRSSLLRGVADGGVSMATKADRPGTAPDWSRFGLSEDQQRQAERGGGADPDGNHDDNEVFTDHHHGDHATEKNELFAEDQVYNGYVQ